jgi:hypothetical protein
MRTTLVVSSAIFGGGAAIFAILWLLAHRSLSGEKILPLFIPFSLLWIATCLGLPLISRLRKGKVANQNTGGPTKP